VTPAFPPAVRLRARGEFDHVQKSGRRVSARFFVLLGRPNALTADRLGIIASRKVGGAVIRNRAKRRVRELFRRQDREEFARRGRPMDLVVIARRALADAPWREVEADFVAALRKLRGERNP
jgi:ribonuclease P protein component